MYSLHDSYVMSRTYESPTRRAHAEATRTNILRALVDLIVDEGPATISIPQVARRADVSVRTVYHYFPTKESLFDGLTAAMDSLVATPDGPIPDAPSSPKELLDSIPVMYRFFEANQRMFQALAVSELGGQVESARRPSRVERMSAALQQLDDRVEEQELWRLRAAVGVLVSFQTYDTLTTTWGLSTDEAAEVTTWSVRTLCDRARRTGVTS